MPATCRETEIDTARACRSGDNPPSAARRSPGVPASTTDTVIAGGSPTMVSPSLRAALAAALPPAAIVDGEALAARPAGWSRPDTLRAGLLVRPETTGEVSAVLRLCHEHRQPVITHGGLTGLVRAADTTPDDLVLSTERMRRIEEIDPAQRVAVVQSGVTLQAIQEAADARGLAFPLDLGARGTATIGGNASTNAGGNRVVRYGMARDMILGVEAVLADGTVIPAMNRLIKNNTGYDLKHLFVGAEGTLGVITRLVLRLREKPGRQDVAVLALPGFDAVVGLLKHMDRELGGSMSAFEAMWPEFYEIVTTPPAKGRPPLPHGHPFYVLLESSSGGAPGDAERFAAACERALEQGLIVDAAIAQSQAEAAAIWALRDDVVQFRRFGPPMSYDVSLPIASMPGYVEAVRAGFRERWPGHRMWVFGHLGDGNLHVVASVPDANAGDKAAADAIVYGELQRVHGSVSAEHGIGLLKKPWLAISRSPAELALMRTIKAALDPLGILNPGRIL